MADSSIKKKEQSETKVMFGIKDGIILLVGNMIGAGIFMTPENIGKLVLNRGLTLMFWVLGGAIALVGAFCYVELGVLFPETGGEGVYLTKAFSPMLGSIYYYLSVFVTMPGATLMIAKNATDSLLNGFIVNNHLEKGTKQLYWISIACVIALLLSLLLAFTINPQTSIWLARISILFKAATISIVLLCGSISAFQKTQQKMPQLPVKETESVWKQITTICCVLFSAMWAYDGWNSINLAGGNVRNPQKTFPVSILVSIPLVTFLYLLLNTVYLWIVPETFFMDSDQKINSPSSEVVSLVCGEVFGNWIFPAFVFFSIVGSANGCFVCAVYLTQTVAQEKKLPSLLGTEQRRGVPGFAAMFQMTISIAFAFLSSSIGIVFSVIAIAMWIFYGLSGAALLVFRKTMASKKRTFKVWTPLAVMFCACSATMVVIGLLSFAIYGFGTRNPFA